MTDVTPRVTIVLPAYNRAGSIAAAIESVLRQTWRDFELLVVDDCSTDGTVAAIDAIADPRLRRLSTPRNMGPSGARNVGIAAARGAWIAFQDSDDEWLPDKLRRQMARLEEPGAGFVAAYCGMLILGDPEGGAEGRMAPRYVPDPARTRVEGDLQRALLAHSLISTQMLVARRDILQEIGGFDTALPSLVDWELAIRLSAHGPIAFVDEPLVLQRFSANSVTRERWRRALSRRRILEKHHDLMLQAPGVLARQWRSVAGDERRLGRMAAAREALARARRVTPLDPRLWLLGAALLFYRDRAEGETPPGDAQVRFQRPES